MDATEAAALKQLGERELWGVDELPAGIDVDLLRGLDASELVEARSVVMQNQKKYPGDPTPPSPSPSGWFSPMRNPSMVGGWGAIMSNRTRSMWKHPCELRVSERGRAELARMRRAATAARPETPANANAQAGGGSPDVGGKPGATSQTANPSAADVPSDKLKTFWIIYDNIRQLVEVLLSVNAEKIAGAAGGLESHLLMIRDDLPKKLHAMQRLCEEHDIDSSPLVKFGTNWQTLWRNHPEPLDAAMHFRDFLPEDFCIDVLTNTAERLKIRLENKQATPDAGALTVSPADEATKLDHPPALDIEDITILGCLSDGVVRDQYFIESKTRFTRKTVGDRLKQMRKTSLTHRPKGERGGEQITSYGLETLKQIKAAQACQ
jgi:hypothetical protein